MKRPRIRHAAAAVGAWTLVAVPTAAIIFAHSSSITALAGHEAVVSPTFDGYATLDLGPYVPSLRYPAGRQVGAHIDLGATHLTSYDALISRYAAIGAQPAGEIAKVSASLRDMALSAAFTGAVAGLAGPGLWVLLGPRRRAELIQQVTARRVTAVGVCGAVVLVALVRPWAPPAALDQEASWRPLEDELPGVPIPERAQPLEVETGLFTTGTKRLAESMLDTYSRSVTFYDELFESAQGMSGELHTPAEDETVALLVSDRHDNIGMDKVAHAIGNAGGATVLIDAGDDTSTGSSWEAFSLDSLDRVFEDYDERYAVVGNHDEGDFVGRYLDELGFTRLDGEQEDGPDDIRFFGADDPRSSGLGSWRDETGLSFSEHAERVADQVCEYDEEGDRIATLVVHDANTGRYALERGCVDLVVGGHVHVQLGPTQVVGDNGKAGYSYTNGTTGGAAFALAIGSKLRRDAQVTLLTYRDGRPVGIQPVTILTVGDFRVGPYLELDLASEETTNGPDGDETP